MKCAFIYDHTFFIINSKVYSSGAFTKDSWKRYLNHFDELIVVGNVVHLPSHKYDRYNRVESEAVQFEYLPSARNIKGYLQYTTGRVKKLQKLLNNVDAVVIRLPSEIGLFASRLADELGKPKLFELVGDVWGTYWSHGSIKGKLLAPLSYWKTRKTIESSKYTIYVTKQYLQSRYPTNGESIAASNVVINVYNKSEITKTRIETFNNNIKKSRIALIGSSDVKFKGHDILLKAIAKLDNPDNYEIHFVGPGKTGWLIELATSLGLNTKNLVFHGKIKAGTQVFSILDRADLYIHPSSWEGLPRTVIEAMSRGLPVLASNVGGIPELIDNEFLHPPRDYSKLASDIQQFYTKSYKERIKISYANRDKAKGYAIDILEKRRIAFFEKFTSDIKKKYYPFEHRHNI
ncbi:MAG: glycosyltransferase [Bacteroidota bacterium]